MDNEIWKDIEGYNGYYQVSNLGRVKNLERFAQKHNGTLQPVKERINTQYAVRGGYKKVVLSVNGVANRFMVHRLVAQAFIPNPGNKPLIDHINGTPDDNRAENIRWTTQKENMNNPITLRRISLSKCGDNNPMKKERRTILQIDAKTGVLVATHIGTKNVDGFISSCISRCCTGQRKTHRGFEWRYADDPSTRSNISSCRF